MADRYCTECGRALGPEDKFCPGCGATIKEWDDYAPETAQREIRQRNQANSNLQLVMLLAFIWTAFALISTVSSILTIDASIDMLKETANPLDPDQSLWDAMGRSEDLYKTITYAECALYTISGILAGISGYYMYKKTNYATARLTLLLSVITSVVGVITLVIGVIVYMMFVKCEGEFES